jgi:hypothetical protein
MSSDHQARSSNLHFTMDMQSRSCSATLASCPPEVSPPRSSTFVHSLSNSLLTSWVPGLPFLRCGHFRPESRLSVCSEAYSFAHSSALPSIIDNSRAPYSPTISSIHCSFVSTSGLICSLDMRSILVSILFSSYYARVRVWVRTLTTDHLHNVHLMASPVPQAYRSCFRSVVNPTTQNGTFLGLRILIIAHPGQYCTRMPLST